MSMADTSTDEIRLDGAPPDDVMAAIDQAAQVARSVASPSPDLLTLSNGVVLRLKAVPPLAMRQATSQIPEPQIPVVHLDDGRDVENPNDPEYVKAVIGYLVKQAACLADVMMILGSKLESVPVGIDGPDDPDWIALLKRAGITFDGIDLSDQYSLYLAWLRFYALPTEDDIAGVIRGITALSGVTEPEVMRAAAAFRYFAGR